MDNLRGAVIFFVVCHHVLLPYYQMGALNSSLESKGILIRSFLNLALNDSQLMSIVFLIAGYFCFISIQKGKKRFVLSKIKHIIIPMFAASYLLGPAAMFLSLVLMGVQKSFFPFLWSHLATELPQFSVFGHLWFLKALTSYYFKFFIVYLILEKPIERLRAFMEEKDFSAKFYFAGIIIFIVLRSAFDFYSLNHINLLSNFSLGFILAISGAEKKIFRDRSAYILVVIILIALTVDLKSFWLWTIRNFNGKFLFFFWDLNLAFQRRLMVFLFFLLFKKFADRKLFIITNFSRLSFGIYICHPFVITILSPFINKADMAMANQIMLLLGATLISSIAIVYLWYRLIEKSKKMISEIKRYFRASNSFKAR